MSKENENKESFEDFSHHLFEKLNNAFESKVPTEEIKKDISEEIENKTESSSEAKYKRKISNFYFWLVISLFGVSYLVSIIFIATVFYVETNLITSDPKLLNAENRSINSTTISVLIAATITQVGAAFYAISKYLFPHVEKKK